MLLSGLYLTAGDWAGLEVRVARLNDHPARCTHYGGLLLPVDEDISQLFYEEMAKIGLA